MGSLQSQIAPRSSLHFPISTGPFRCSRCYLQGFYISVAQVPSEAVPFVYLASVCWSPVPNFCPDTGGRRWPLIRVASSLALQGGTGAAFPIYAAQAPGCSIWRGPCAARGSSPPRVFHKSAEQKAAPAFCAFPVRAAQAARSLTGALSPGAAHLLPSTVPVSVSTCASRVRAPFALCVPSPSPRPRRSGACALCLTATLPADIDHPESQEVFD